MKVLKKRQAQVSQGDVFQDVEMVEWVRISGQDVEVSQIIFPLVIVLTQDCDLAQDYRVRWSRTQTVTQDKKLLSVLVSPLYNAEHVYAGTHLEDIGQSMEPINRTKTPGKNLRQNETPRYHYVDFPENIPIGPSVIDFKHYFSVSIEYLKKRKGRSFVCKVGELFREDISQRFASYLSRIGLP